MPQNISKDKHLYESLGPIDPHPVNELGQSEKKRFSSQEIQKIWSWIQY
jgi:hypothetical protein